VAGSFSNSPFPDLALLDEESARILVYRSDGHGGFTQTVAVAAGDRPTGLSARDINGDGKLDLLVGNEFGDLLILLGNGDGTFQSFTRVDQSVALAVADLNGDGQDDFVFANPALDHVSVEYGQSQAQVFQSRQDGLLAPGAVTTADMNADGIPDLVVANSGGNEVLVYLGLGNGQFGPKQAFPVGTDPVGLTVQDLNGDGLPDLIVANRGSNDVSIFTSKIDSMGWTLEQGTRFAAGIGPVSTTVVTGKDAQGNTVPVSLLVTNSGSNNVYQFTSRGDGFFNLTPSAIYPAGNQPQQTLVGDFNGDGRTDLVTLNQGSNNLTFFSNFGTGVSIATGGTGPVAAVAGDFNHDGIADLIVAHNGDGLLSLLLGQADGPSLAGTLSSDDLLHPTALSVAGMENQAVDLYVAQEGEETVARLTFDLHFGLPAPGLVPDPVRPPVAELAPLQDSNLALVATLLTGGEPTDKLTAGATEPPEVTGLTNFVIGLDEVRVQAVGPGLLARGGGGEEGPFLAGAQAVLDSFFRKWTTALWSGVSRSWGRLAGCVADIVEPMAALPGRHWGWYQRTCPGPISASANLSKQLPAPCAAPPVRPWSGSPSQPRRRIGMKRGPPSPASQTSPRSSHAET